MSLCGIPQRDAAGNSPHDRQNKKGRLALVEEAVEKVYKHYGDNEKEKERIVLGAEYRDRYHSFSIDASNPPFPYFVGVSDTVRALGIPGSSGLVLWRHAFHNAALNARVPYARQALSIDENRQIFAPEVWDNERNRRKPRHVVVSSRFGSPVCIRTSAVAIPRQAYPIWPCSG